MSQQQGAIEDKLNKALDKYYSQRYHTVEDEFNDGLKELQAIITTETTNARIETAEEMERIALKAATRTPKDTLDVMVAIEKYVKDLQKEQP